MAVFTVNDAICHKLFNGVTDKRLREKLGEVDRPDLDSFMRIINTTCIQKLLPQLERAFRRARKLQGKRKRRGKLQRRANLCRRESKPGG